MCKWSFFTLAILSSIIKRSLNRYSHVLLIPNSISWEKFKKKETRNLSTHFYYYDKHRHFEYICKLFILFMRLNHEHFFLFLSVILHNWKKKQILATCIKNVVVAYKSFSLVYYTKLLQKIDQTLTIFLSFSFFLHSI